MRVEKEVKVVKEYKEVIKEIDVFVSQDGKKHSKREEAEKHERVLNIPNISYTLPGGKRQKAYRLENEQDLMDLEFYGILKDLSKHQVVFPGWYVLEKQYDVGMVWDGSVTEIITPLNQVKQHLSDLLNMLPNE